MIDKASKILTALDEMKNASLTNPEQAMKKYDIMFLGERFNVITSTELLHTLNNYFGIQIEKDELMRLIPVLSDLNKITCEPLRLLDNPDFSAVDAYMITLDR